MKKFLTSAFAIAVGMTSAAQETINMPLIQTKYTADPAPYVHGDTVYLYTTHDEDNAEGFAMKDWLLYTSTDMVNWQDHGAVASLKDFNGIKVTTEHGPNAWLSVTANGTCTAPSTDTASVFSWPIRLSDHSKTRSANHWYGKRTLVRH